MSFREDAGLRTSAEKAECRRRASRASHVIIAALFLSACMGNMYLGIPLVMGRADPELQKLASRARDGDKPAQLELGIRFEEGRGVMRDLEKAESLYRQAASDSGGKIWVYIPSPGGGAAGHVVQMGGGARKIGMPEARIRLERLMRIPDKN